MVFTHASGIVLAPSSILRVTAWYIHSCIPLVCADSICQFFCLKTTFALLEAALKIWWWATMIRLVRVDAWFGGSHDVLPGGANGMLGVAVLVPVEVGIGVLMYVSSSFPLIWRNMGKPWALNKLATSTSLLFWNYQFDIWFIFLWSLSGGTMRRNRQVQAWISTWPS